MYTNCLRRWAFMLSLWGIVISGLETYPQSISEPKK
jgi:hypothetical protein